MKLNTFFTITRTILFLSFMPNVSLGVNCKWPFNKALDAIVNKIDNLVLITENQIENSITIERFGKKYVINYFERLQTNSQDLKLFLEDLSRKEFLKEIELLKSLTERTPSLNTVDSLIPLKFNKEFKEKVKRLFSDKSISIDNRLISYFDLYWNERLSLLNSIDKKQLDDIFDNLEGDKLGLCKDESSCYSFQHNKVLLSGNYRYVFNQLLFQIHEGEHAITNIENSIYLKTHLHSDKSIEHKESFQFLEKLHRLQNEGNSIAAQWEFVQYIPENIRKIIIDELSIYSKANTMENDPEYIKKFLGLLEKAFQIDHLPDSFIKSFFLGEIYEFHSILLEKKLIPSLPENIRNPSFLELRIMKDMGMKSPEIAHLLRICEKNLDYKEYQFLKRFFLKPYSELNIQHLKQIENIKTVTLNHYNIEKLIDTIKEIKHSRFINLPLDQTLHNVVLKSLENADLSKFQFIKELRVIHRYDFKTDGQTYILRRLKNEEDEVIPLR